MTPQEVIAHVILVEHAMTVDDKGLRCSCGEVRDTSERLSPEDEHAWYALHAQHVTAKIWDALHANGHVVVQLPEPSARMATDTEWQFFHEAESAGDAS